MIDSKNEAIEMVEKDGMNLRILPEELQNN